MGKVLGGRWVTSCIISWGVCGKGSVRKSSSIENACGGTWTFGCIRGSIGWGTSLESDPLYALSLYVSYGYVTPRVPPFAPTHPPESNKSHRLRLWLAFGGAF